MDRDPQNGTENLETPNLCTADTKPGFGVHGCWQDEKRTWPVHSKRLRTPREGYILEELTDFTGCLPSSSWKGHSKKPLQTSQHGGKVRSSAWKNQIKSALAAELLFSSAPKLFLLLVKPTACQLITTCSQFPLHLPRTSLASQAEMWTEHRTAPYQWAGFRHRDTTAPPQSG